MDAPALALPLDERRDVLRHLRQQDAHRQIGERKGESYGGNQENNAQNH